MTEKRKSDNSTRKYGNRSQLKLALAVLIVFLIFFASSDDPAVSRLRNDFFRNLGITRDESLNSDISNAANNGGGAFDGQSLPEYDGKLYYEVNGNVPVFPDEIYNQAGLVNDGNKWNTEGSLSGEIDAKRLISYEYYGDPDNLGRCTAAYGCLSVDTMPEPGEKRGDISSIHPSGWARGQEWERAHLIAWSLSAENANERNLVTGTHRMNYDAMRPFEEKVENYIWNTGNHVLYMSKPWFEGNELVPRGVQISAWSVEDRGDGISFNIYCYNVTPGAVIDYNTGVVTTEEQANRESRVYVINTRTGIFHYPTCEGAQKISKRNRREVKATRPELTEKGYMPCGYCEP